MSIGGPTSGKPGGAGGPAGIGPADLMNSGKPGGAGGPGKPGGAGGPSAVGGMGDAATNFGPSAATGLSSLQGLMGSGGFTQGGNGIPQMPMIDPAIAQLMARQNQFSELTGPGIVQNMGSQLPQPLGIEGGGRFPVPPGRSPFSSGDPRRAGAFGGDRRLGFF